MEFNVNNEVKVRLTPHGLHILKMENPVSYKYNFNPSNNVLTEQLWIVMFTFGKHLYNGSKILFVDNNVHLKEIN